ncbi:ABC transporter ATP-binding protein [Paenibacillus ehimensis]|uniref:ABC transporter ATP-binding protein n=1 Tax=Paenibacillus ehimensis TaxID=79264 RepID=UPI00046EC334|nr:ABC transporter ATP-binding protein [Paenibacillus ehimensis]MEC0213811.1 ABC transporter ATP-binding protein [Paenibacillus ehimensis]
MNPIVEVNRLTKSYGNVMAVDDISFAIQPNKIYGLLGRNGAGKTTVMHMITAQIFPTSGDIEVFGENPYENNSALSKMCFIKESQKYPDSFQVVDVLEVAESLFPQWDREYAYELIETFGLPLKRKMKKLSRGMLSAAGIVVGLASRAPLTIFDEPYLGLDAVARGLFYEKLLEDYSAHPRTVVLSTHLIDEVSRILEYVIVIDRGKLILNEDTEALRGRAFTVIGTAHNVEKFIRAREIIHQEGFGGLMSATVMDELSDKDRKEGEALGLEFSPVSLQQLVVHLTKHTSDRKAGIAL